MENDVKKQPAKWKPINVDKFNKKTEVISEMFKSDPERLERMKKNIKNESNDS